jgi:uncharacterized oligopeptide transporter (OPT) family protein
MMRIRLWKLWDWAWAPVRWTLALIKRVDIDARDVHYYLGLLAVGSGLYLWSDVGVALIVCGLLLILPALRSPG